MKVLVTGGTGFIGSHIVESLVYKGYEVTVFDNFSTGLLKNISSVKDDVEIINGDILDAETLEKAFRGIDIVSHQAAQLEIFRSTDDPYFDLKVNTVGTLNILKIARSMNVEKVINASSACIYGQVDGLTPETHYPKPNWEYGVSKLAAEKYCDIYSEYMGLPVVNLRYAITYGEREWFRRVLTIFVKRVILGKSPVVFGDGEQIRDFIYVGDVVDFHNKCLEAPVVNGESYNVSTGIPTTIAELGRKVVEASGINVEIIYEDTREGEFSKLVHDKKRNIAELKVMLLDNSKAKKDLDWQPEIALIDGLKKQIKWATENIERWEQVYYSQY